MSLPDAPAPGPQAAQRGYEERCFRFASERDELEREAQRLSNYRVISFLLVVAALVWAELKPETATLALALAGLFGAVFLLMVRRHRRVRRRSAWLHELWLVNDEGRRRVERRWDGLPALEPRPEDVDHPYAGDLDLLGRASLSQLLGVPGTPAGRTTLRRWLLSAAPPGEVRERQAAVEELAGRLDLRDEVAVRGRQSAAVSWEELDRFLAWAEEGGGWPGRRRDVVWTARLLPVATLAAALLQAIGVLGFHYWAVGVATGLGLSALVSRRVRKVYERAFPRSGVFRHYSGLFRLLEESEFGSPLLRRVQGELRATPENDAASREMRGLERLMEMADLRFSQLHLPVQAVTLWDVHVLEALDRWQRAAGPRIRAWFAALGEAEAVAGLASLRHDHPGWVFPEFLPVEGPGCELTAVSIGHPLLDPAVRVANDVALGPRGTFLMVTGSNMSGKSTLLRAIGVNVVLAQAGAPVCAARLQLPPVELHTSMRVADSLERGLSRFMAELQRLKRIVEAARGARPDRPVLYLLDEVLGGTNAAERRVAARGVLRHLLEQPALGAITTHDLDLADEPDLAARAVPVHFTETFEEDEEGRTRMTFDYRLRSGIATSTNALKLVRMMGLD